MNSPPIIIGAGPAGLAVAACLQQAGIDSIVLEQADRVGSSWHRHYERLHLHTDKTRSALPSLPFPADCPRYPSRTQVIDYFERYAQHFGIEPRFGRKVVGARRTDDRWVVETNQDRFETAHLVVATGHNAAPHVPEWSDRERFNGTVMHSSEYRNGAPFSGRDVLVVGFGNSGGEIAIDLHEHGSRPALAVRSAVNVIPRELFGVPILAVGKLQRLLPPRLADALNAPLLRFVIGDLRRYGLRKLPYGPATQVRIHHRIPLIDVGTLELIEQGAIVVRPGIERFTADGVAFTDGREQSFAAVILATGYRPRVTAFLQDAGDALDDQGAPRTSGGPTAVPGLYFCGFYVSPNGMLGEIAGEAQRISAVIARR
ncbi:MAG: NAD(P)/FAD-dependent oxidoreductase [Acidobacteriota bacterium]|jgi:cation diffusion facilitator CzcD-associated flavoprotein CzcO